MADDDLFGSDDDLDTSSQDNKSFKELRTAYNRTEKERKALETEVTELRSFKDTVVQDQKKAALESTFREVGLNPKHVPLFEKINPDLDPASINRDAVAAFAAEYELVTTAGTTVETPEEKPVGFTPVVTGTGTPSTKLSMEDINKMLRAGDSEGVAKAFKDGRVEVEQNPWSRQG
jgi:dihydroorotate dehydrogenase